MNMGSWNVLGVCESFKQRELRAWITKHQLAMAGVMETRVRVGRSPHIIDNIMPTWQSLSNYSHHPNGRIWLLWDPSILNVYPRMITDQLIHVEVLIIQKQVRFYVTFIYGLNCYVQRRNLWDSVRSLSTNLDASPWLLLGDYNVVRFSSERIRGDQSWPNYMNELNDCCNYNSLEDLRFSRQLYTWSKGSGSTYKARKLDRALVNPNWHLTFPEAEAIFHEVGASDHSPILVKLGVQLQIRKPPFKFFSFWADHPQFEEVVSTAWATQIEGSPTFSFVRKLKGLKAALKLLNKTEFANLSERTRETRDSLLQIQRQLIQFQGDENLKYQEKQAFDKLLLLSKAEESFLKQKSRIRWIKKGDSNTKFFHHSMRARYNKNKIISIVLDSGERVHEPAYIHAAAVDFFGKLYSPSASSSAPGPRLENFVSKTISPAQANTLTRPVTSEEIKKTIFHMKADKAPGPDGFSALFFQKSWHIVGEEVTQADQYFFDTGRLLKELNHTSLSLVPKVPNLSSFSDFHPIACCNLIYKCISGIMAARLKRSYFPL